MSTVSRNKTPLGIYVLGSCGITVGGEYSATARSSRGKSARIIGLDSSRSEEGTDVPFVVERMEGMSGGGKVMKNIHNANSEDFVDTVFTKHKPCGFNVVIAGTSGATGAMLLLNCVEKFLAEKVPFVVFQVIDVTSEIEIRNAKDYSRNLDALRVKYNAPIAIRPFKNAPGVTLREINRDICRELDLVSLLLTEDNNVLDYADIYHFLRYNEAIKINPALSELKIYDQTTIQQVRENEKPPVAIVSIYKDRLDIKNDIVGMAYRAPGEFNKDEILPDNMTELHFVLTHGELTEQLSTLINDQKDRASIAKTVYSENKQLGNSDGSFSFGD